MDYVESSTQEQVQQQPVIEQKPQERVFTQSELNEIVGRAKRDAAESAKKHIQSAGVEQKEAISEEYIRKLASAELEKQRQAWLQESEQKANEERAKKIVESYKKKIDSDKSQYEDFDTVVQGLDMGLVPNVVQLLAEYTENSAGVLYELARNRTKMYAIENMCNKNPSDAIHEIKRLEKSIKDAKESGNYKQAKAPLSQQKSSSVGMSSGKPLTVADFKKMYKG